MPTEAPKMVEISTQVPADRQEAFLRLVREFHAGGTRHDLEVRARGADRQQGIASLHELVKVAQGNSGQCRYIARFLAGLYNGQDYPFDLTDLRAIDDALFEHAMAVLRMDHRLEQEVHCYFPNGGDLWQDMIKDWGIGQEQMKSAAQRLGSYLWDKGGESKDFQQKALGNQLVNLFKE